MPKRSQAQSRTEAAVDHDCSRPDCPLRGQPFLVEVWHSMRPFCVRLAEDFGLSASLWLSFFLFSWILTLLPVEGWASDFIHGIHAAATVATYGLFAGLFLLNIYRVRLRHAA